MLKALADVEAQAQALNLTDESSKEMTLVFTKGKPASTSEGER